MNQKHFLVSFLTTGLMLALSLGTSIILARSLGPEGRGLLLALTFWPGLLAALLNFSIAEATIYHSARASVADDAGSGARHAETASVLQLAIALLAAGMTVLLMQWVLPEDRRIHLDKVILYAAAFVPLTIMDLHFRAVLQGRGAIAALNVVRICQPAAYITALSALLIAGELRVETVMAAMIAAVGCAALAGMLLARIWGRIHGRETAADLVRTGIKFHLANMLIYAAAETDKLIVLGLMNDRDIGYYAVALAVSTVGSGLVVQSLKLMLVPEMASSLTDEDRRAVFVRNFHFAVVLLVIINGTAAGTAPWWLPFLFGDAFSPAIGVTAILLAMGALKGLRQIIDIAVRATHVTRIGMIGECITLGGLAVFGILGASVAGIQGLAIGLLLAQLSALVVMIIMACRYLGLGIAELWPVRQSVADQFVALLARRQSWGQLR